jgi:tRNA pseudouridine32 synthase/23S rRNA pseudouridine746 synthase
MTEDPIQIIHEDPEFLVVVKVSGFLSVPGRGPEKLDSVSERIRHAYPGCIDQPAVHRLDMDTSGLLVLARTATAHRNLSMQFQQRKTEKQYVALLDGILEQDEGTIELPFRLDIGNRPYQIYDEIHGKMGITHWKKQGVEGDYTRVIFHPVTGRTHQLRVHAAHEKGLGIPIVGDPLYGNGDAPGKLKLHASNLAFFHPLSGELLKFTSEARF